jgi:hypothetical protein
VVGWGAGLASRIGPPEDVSNGRCLRRARSSSGDRRLSSVPSATEGEWQAAHRRPRRTAVGLIKRGGRRGGAAGLVRVWCGSRPARRRYVPELTSTVGRVGKNDAREGVSSHSPSSAPPSSSSPRFARIVFAIRRSCRSGVQATARYSVVSVLPSGQVIDAPGAHNCRSVLRQRTQNVRTHRQPMSLG